MSKQRAKGTRFETEVVGVLAEWFPHCERRALRGNQDGGDIAGLPIPIECKNTISIDLAGGCKEAEAASKRLGAHGWVAVFKRPRRGPQDAYAVFPLWFAAELLDAWDNR